MQRIIVEVDDFSGNIYQKLPQENKRQFSQAVAAMLKKAINDTRNADYMHMLDDFGNEAISNGLTEDILADILAE